ncbi:glycoside hydrolase family 172 protein [Compostibacter hankyongensis]|uniref:DUF2961 domain-containing protein n=1 Tax=Compostibacter hankyongensis TaxID=1007089 RepID=A0ABP8FZA8_9BACT
MKRLHALSLTALTASLLFAIPLSAQQTVSTASELKKIADIGNLPSYPDGPERQFSSYDTTGGNDDGFSGKYSFIRKNPDGSSVIFEAKGNGVINRIWTPTPNDDTLDFYFGDRQKPGFSIRFSDLFSGKVFPFVAPLCGNQVGGYFCYVPIPYHNGCKIVFRGKKMQFYQIQYRSYPANRPVEDFNPHPGPEESALLKSIAASWAQNGGGIGSVYTQQPSGILHTDTLLVPGHSITLAQPDHGGRILGIRLGPAAPLGGLHKQVDLKITWDGAAEPAVYAPVADFFGFAFGKPSMQSLLMGAAGDTAYCYFPMPFDHSARIELIYRALPGQAADPIRIKADVFLAAKPRDPQTEGRFYAYWNKDIRPPEGHPHVFLQGKGKGHYVGTILQAQGLRPGMTLFFEGDDTTAIDGIPTLHGTGSEDYFNGGWYALLDRWDRKMSLPLHGALDYSLPYSRTGGYRLFLGDKLSFSKSIYHAIEHGPEGNAFPVDYTSVALYYANAPLAVNPQPANGQTAVFLPDTLMLYPQLMSFNFAGAVTVDGSRFTAPHGGRMRIDLSELPHGHYKLYADTETEPQGAEITCWQRQTAMSGPISFYSSGKRSQPRFYLCDLQLDDFRNTVTLAFKQDDTRNRIRINRLILIRQKEE